jgi:hypothetical protein
LCCQTLFLNKKARADSSGGPCDSVVSIASTSVIDAKASIETQSLSSTPRDLALTNSHAILVFLVVDNGLNVLFSLGSKSLFLYNAKNGASFVFRI